MDKGTNTMVTFLMYYKVVMSLFYIAFGLFIIVYPNSLKVLMEPNITRMVGAFVIAYGSFRFYRVWFVDRKQASNSENDSSIK